MSGPPHFIGVDVGTGSVRAGVFDANGQLLAHASHDIQLFQDTPDHAEQSSADIWQAVCKTTRAAITKASVAPQTIVGIGFDATCSLVVIGADGTGLPVGVSGEADRDIIVWLDHRATDQAKRINQSGHRVLKYVGGVISPEMETPKLLWLKENLPETYQSARHFFDLVDFLSWKATGSTARSMCTVTCKWTYMAHEKAWDATYFEGIGLGDLSKDNFARIGADIVEPGTPLAQGLTQDAADALGLVPGTPVAAGLIDAHAGGVGAMTGDTDVTSNLVYVFGTSACTMASSERPHFIPGVWGPYHSAMVPGLWLNEGGQSSAGAAMERLLALHPAAVGAAGAAKQSSQSLPDYLAALTVERAPHLSEAAYLAGTLLVIPDFLGNRAPHADPEARAIIAGLGMDQDLESLIALYVAGLLGIGYGLRQIIETSGASGATIKSVTVIGGAGRHPLIAQLLADCTGLPVIHPEQPEPVLLGASMLGASASGSVPNLNAAMSKMSSPGDTIAPTHGAITALHNTRFSVFESLQKAAQVLKKPTSTEAFLGHAEA
ncbi:ribulokinase [Jannaschia sp. EhC01]|nr:ribulokinase [Jannaschia sp. EhC01]